MLITDVKFGDTVIFNTHPYHYLGSKVIKGRMSHMFILELKDKTWKKILWADDKDVSRHQLKKNNDGSFEW